MNLKDIKKENGLTNAAIGRAIGYSVNTVGMIMQGRHIHIITDKELETLASALGVTFERCWLAMVESHNEWAGTPGQEYTRNDERMEEAMAIYGKLASGSNVNIPARKMGVVDSDFVVPEERRIP